MHSIARVAASLGALLVVANCSAAPGATQMTRNAPTPFDPVVATPGVRPGDLACLAEAVYFEARGTGSKGEAAVAHVVVNRSKSSKFGPGTVCGIVAEGCQFSYRCDGRPETLTDQQARAKAFKVAETVLAGAPDITDGALFFHSARMTPGWFASRPRIGTFGGNVFYR